MAGSHRHGLIGCIIGVVVLLAVACGSGGDGSEENTGSVLTDLPDAPLSARNDAVVAAIGRQVVVFGGDDFICPPTADCALPNEPPLADGAILDLDAMTWKSMADAPVGVAATRPVTVDDDVYTLLQCEKSPRCPLGNALLRYTLTADEWSVLPGLPVNGYHLLTAVGGQVFAVSGTAELPAPDYRYDTESEQWVELPEPPMVPAYDRFGVDVGGRLVLYGSPIEGPDSRKRVASYDPATDVWTQLGPAPSQGFQPFAVDGRVVLNPHFGSAVGGIHDPTEDSWTELPAVPEADSWGGDIAGVVGTDTASFEHSTGWVLDLTDGSWVEIGNDKGDSLAGESVATVGDELFVFGGHYFTDGETLIQGGAQLWTPA